MARVKHLTHLVNLFSPRLYTCNLFASSCMKCLLWEISTRSAAMDMQAAATNHDQTRDTEAPENKSLRNSIRRTSTAAATLIAAERFKPFSLCFPLRAVNKQATMVQYAPIGSAMPINQFPPPAISWTISKPASRPRKSMERTL